MDILAFIFIWPFLVLVFGLLFISASGLGEMYAVGVWPLLISFLIIWNLFKKSGDVEKGENSSFRRMDSLRRSLVSVSIAFLLPIFVRYLVGNFEGELWIIILGLVIGFAFTLWGMFAKNNKVLIYGNLLGGALVLFYIYSQLWKLGDVAKIIAAAFGLGIATIVSIIKLKDKL